MAEKKCFCHLNGYEVKDAQARRDIDDLYTRADEIENEAADRMDQFGAVVDAHGTRIAALEEGGGSGGKLYKHDYYVILNYNHNGSYYNDQITFSGTVYSSSDTKLTSDDVLNFSRYNGFVEGGVMLNDGGTCYDAFCAYLYKASDTINITAKCIDRYDGSYIDYMANIKTINMYDLTVVDTVTEV